MMRNVEERNKTADELLLKPLKHPLKTFDELLKRCLPTLTARLWACCCWSDSMNNGWKIGDYNFLIFSVTPEEDTHIYVQFWSEPQEAVTVEVSSGEWSPATLQYTGTTQKELLKRFGFQIGGRAKNFQKQVSISSSADAESVARDVLQIFLTRSLGYRGQWPLSSSS